MFSFVIAKRRPPVAVLTAGAVGVALVLTTLVAIVASLRRPPIDISDFAAFWRAGRWTLNGRNGDLYPDSSFGGVGGGSFKGFVNPPHVVALFAPFAMLSLRSATAAFIAVNGVVAACLAAAGWRSLRQSEMAPPFAAALLLIAFGSVAVTTTFINGSLSLVVAGVMVLVVHLDRDGDRWVTGAAAALLSIKPQYAVLPFAFLVARYRWRAAAGTIGATTALVVATLPMTGIRAWTRYPSFLARYANSLDIWNTSNTKELWLARQMLNVRGLLVRMLGTTHVSLINALSAVVLVVAVAVVVVLARRSTASNQQMTWAAVIGLTVVTSQHTNVADGTLLFVSLFLIAAFRPIANATTDQRWTSRVVVASSTLNLAMLFGNPSRLTPIVPWSGIVALTLVGGIVASAFRAGLSNAIAVDTPARTNAANRSLFQPS